MLPDLRIVIAAVISTFLFTVGVGFFASSRLIHEQMTARVDTRGFDDTPINRIALNWPEPTRIERKVELDFAVSKAAPNPVRDVTSDAEQTSIPPKAEIPDAVQHGPVRDEAVRDQVADTAPDPADATPEMAAAEPEIPADDLTSNAEPPAATASEPSMPKLETISESSAPKTDAADSEPAPSVAEASDPAESPAQETSPSAPSSEASATSAPTADPSPAVDTRVIVHLDATAHEPDTPPSEATGSIAAPATPETRVVPLPEPRPNLAALTDTPAARAVATLPTAETASPPAIRKKRPRRTTRRPTQNPAPQPVQPQPFKLFGLFPIQPQVLPLQTVSTPTP